MDITMRLFAKIATLLTICLMACTSGPQIKTAPEYVGVDPEAQPFVDEYMWLGAQNHLHFDKQVTVGFKVINDGRIVGMCNYGGWFREIDLDTSYWIYSTKTTRMTLMFHELTHCYCDRAHDYGKGDDYPEAQKARIRRAIEWRVEGGPRPGYWADGCPVSIMHPVLLSDDCMLEHYQEYTTEMFDRCDAW